MTRDEAITIRSKSYPGSEEWQRKRAAEDVDSWAALGILKFDKAKKPADRAVDILDGLMIGYQVVGRANHILTREEAGSIVTHLRMAGLSIVDAAAGKTVINNITISAPSDMKRTTYQTATDIAQELQAASK